MARGLEETFNFYTEQLDKWWPKLTHSIGREKTDVVAMECKLGGRIYETQADGTEMFWGTVLEWDAPNRLVHSWHVGREEDEATEVEITFKDAGNGQTLVELTHRNWENLGEVAEMIHGQYGPGWDHVFGKCFGDGVKAS